MEKEKKNSIIFTPDNEPYLGRLSVFHFDEVIISCLEANQDIALFTHSHDLSPLQKAACEIIPHGIHIALSIRELVRQGYLYGAVVLMRPLIERSAIISYLFNNPEEVKKWENGWEYSERPSLKEMLQTMGPDINQVHTKKLCDQFNHITHGDPIGSLFNIISMSNGKAGFAVSKHLNNKELCDFICFQSYCYLIVLMGMMAGIFPKCRD